MSSGTAVFAVEAVRKWWYAEGKEVYGESPEMVIAIGCGGVIYMRTGFGNIGFRNFRTRRGRRLRYCIIRLEQVNETK
jgi:hypothetical protein